MNDLKGVIFNCLVLCVNSSPPLFFQCKEMTLTRHYCVTVILTVCLCDHIRFSPVRRVRDPVSCFNSVVNKQMESVAQSISTPLAKMKQSLSNSAGSSRACACIFVSCTLRVTELESNNCVSHHYSAAAANVAVKTCSENQHKPFPG